MDQTWQPPRLSTGTTTTTNHAATTNDAGNGRRPGLNKDHMDPPGPQQRKLSLQILNVCGLRRKIEIPEFRNALKSHDISLLCETKLDDADNDTIQEAVKDLNLKVFFKNRKALSARRSGGLCIIINKNIEK